jgi:hypothetical protein
MDRGEDGGEDSGQPLCEGCGKRDRQILLVRPMMEMTTSNPLIHVDIGISIKLNSADRDFGI